MTLSLVCHASTYLECKRVVLNCCCLSPVVGSEWHIRLFEEVQEMTAEAALTERLDKQSANAYSYVQVTRVMPSMVAGQMVIEVRLHDGRAQMYSESQWQGLTKFPLRPSDLRDLTPETMLLSRTLGETLLDAEYRIFGTATGRLRSTANKVSIRK